VLAIVGTNFTERLLRNHYNVRFYEKKRSWKGQFQEKIRKAWKPKKKHFYVFRQISLKRTIFLNQWCSL